MTPPPGLEAFHLTPSLLNASSRSSTSKPHSSPVLSEKEREETPTEVEKEPKGATGGQAGGPVRTRTRKTSRANLFMSKPHSDSKHLNHSSGIPVSKGIASTSAVVNSAASLKVIQGSVSHDSEEELVSVIQDLVQTTCLTTENDKLDSSSSGSNKAVDVDGQVCNHLNHSGASSVKEATPPDSASSQSTSAGMPC